LINLLTEYNL